jgi:1,4-alpha-glucan branching enzyme
MHRGVQLLVRDLNRLYRGTPALHGLDSEAEGFQWLEASDAPASVLCFLRRGRSPDDAALVVCNFTPVIREDWAVGVPHGGLWHERINTDAIEYGGSGVGNSGTVHAAAEPMHGQPCSLRLRLPPLATLILTTAA